MPRTQIWTPLESRQNVLVTSLPTKHDSGNTPSQDTNVEAETKETKEPVVPTSANNFSNDSSNNSVLNE